MFWDVLVCFVTFCHALGVFWDVMGQFGMFWDVLGCFGTFWDI